MVDVLDYAKKNLSAPERDSERNYSKNRKGSREESERTAPYSFEAEKAFLGSILISPGKLDAVSSILSADDFYDPRHQLIYEAMLSLDNNHRVIDTISLQETLENTQSLEKAGGQAYLLQLFQAVPDTIDAVTYAHTIVNKSRARMLLKACQEIEEDVYVPRGRSIGDILNGAEQKIFRISENSLHKGGGPVSITRVTMDLLNTLRENQKNNLSGITGVPTGYKFLDQYLSGFHKSDLIVIGARPGVGKTTFGMNLVQNVAMNPDVNFPVLVFSLEMPASQIAARLLAAMAHVDQTKIRNSNLDDDDWVNLIGVGQTLLKERPDCIYIDDTQGLTPADIRSRSRRLKQEKGGISMIMVDYLQYMHIPGYDANSRTQEVAECSKSLKMLARELDVPVIAMAQVNRGVAGRKDKRPGNADLRESGAIEQDADVIMFIHRPEMDDDKKDDPSQIGKAEIIIGKQRNGPVGIVPMVFLHEYSRFETVEFSGGPVPPPGAETPPSGS